MLVLYYLRLSRFLPSYNIIDPKSRFIWRSNMKTIGVLGGLGPQATMDFEARIHAVSQQLTPPKANPSYPPMVVYYYRHSPFLMREEHTPVFPLQPDPRILDAVKKLGACADFLVITS